MSKGNWMLILSSYDKNEGSCKRINGAVKGDFCKGKCGLLLLLCFAEKMREGDVLEIKNLWIRTPFQYKGT